MRIGFDIRPFLKEETGIGVYLKSLLHSLSQIDRENVYFFFSSSLKDRFPREKIPPFARMRMKDFRFPVKAVNFFWHSWGWPTLDRFFSEKLDLTHSAVPLAVPTKGRKIVTVHDLFFLDYPGKVDKEAQKVFARKVKGSLEKSDGIITISHYMKGQIVERFGLSHKKIRVIHHGTNPRFYERIPRDDAGNIRKDLSIPSSFILFVGTIEPRKNLSSLIKALKILHKKGEEISLVIAGREGNDSESLKIEIERRSLSKWIKILGYLPDKELRAVYQSASLLAFPSLCEGFGLPVLEAMASGLPVVASRVSAIPEVAQDAALYFNPENPEEMAEKMGRVLREEGLRKQMIRKGEKRALQFDWMKTARETLSFYQSIVGKES